MRTKSQIIENESMLQKAHRITTQDRRDEYGHPADDFAKIAKQWEVTLGCRVTPQQVALCMIQVKIARLCHSPNHEDSVLDIAGYANCIDMIRQRQRELECGTSKQATRK